MTNLWQDIIFGFRMLAKKPALTAVAALSLALGIGANTVIFSLVNATLLGPISYPQPERVGVIWGFPDQRPDDRNSLTVADLRLIAAQNQSFESVGGVYQNTKTLSATAGEAGENGLPAERLACEQFTSSMFQVLGVAPRLGRVFIADEDRDTAPAPVVVLSDRFWQRHYNADPNVLGRILTIDGVKHTVIGVMPPGFDFMADDTDVFTPAGFLPAQISSNATFLIAAARLKPGVTWPAAGENVKRLGVQFAAAFPERDKGKSLRAETVREAMNRGIRRPLLILEGAVVFVLLIACANVANLLLARASSRQTEVAIRTALGAGRGRVIRQLLTESLLLAVLGGCAGAALGWASLRLCIAALPADAGALLRADVDPRVLAFTAVVSLLTGLFFGVVPALQGSKTDLTVSLKETGKGGSAGRAKMRFRGGLVIAQIGLSLVLLIGAGLTMNSFYHLVHNDLGLDPSHVLAFNFRFPQAQMMKQVGRYRGMGLWEIFPDVEPTYDRILERVRSLPGVQSAALANFTPFGGGGMGMQFRIEGRPAPATDAERQNMGARYVATSSGFFSTLKIPLLRGRDFNDRDTAAAPLVVILNQTFANRYFPGENPLGQRIRLDFVPDEQPREIVGVVGDSRFYPYEKNPAAAIFLPHVQQTTRWEGPSWNARASMTFLLKTAGDPVSQAAAVRHAAAEVDPNKPVSGLSALENLLSNDLAGDRLMMLLLGAFGFVAVTLAAVGIYGVMSYTVAQRTHEIGIRMALGAGRADVLRLVVRNALFLIAGGVVLGLGGSFGLTRLLAEDLFGVTPTDPLTFVSVSALLIAVALLATVIPTRRATRVEPTIALRYE